MGTVTQLREVNEPAMTTAKAVGSFTANYVSVELAAKSRKSYGFVLDAFRARFGEIPVTDLDPDDISAWFRARWGDGSPSGWNVARSVLRKMRQWCTEQGWDFPDPFTRLAHRKTPRDRSRALSRAQITQLLEDRKTGIREKLLWAMLYESAARVAEVLALNVEGLNLASHSAKVSRKGGAQDLIGWDSRTAMLLPRYLKGRTSGPLFLTERTARNDLGRYESDLDAGGKGRLSYNQAADIFREWVRANWQGQDVTLHQLRHSRLTHLAEDGLSTFAIQGKAGHLDPRTSARYAKPGFEAIQVQVRKIDTGRR